MKRDGEEENQERNTGYCRKRERWGVGAGETGRGVQREVCRNRTVEHIASGSRLLLLLQMAQRHSTQIDVSL